MTDVTEALPIVDLAVDVTPPAPAGPPAWLGPLSRLATVPRILTWTGLAVTVVGFVLIAVGWGKVAAETAVSQQVPYIMSAGVVGLGLVLVGLTIVAIDAKLADGRLRREQAAELVTRLDVLVAVTKAQR